MIYLPNRCKVFLTTVRFFMAYQRYPVSNPKRLIYEKVTG
ncbi:hypothetical protein BFO_2622 [Tannerella forsythia 92A2]|uniref:Uncharacterized protein n=1 Tax=Tannerella forsythia (strain ATCC 43037 / JCM 10827 / CCUG 21028 A / KCTC 5666 / FDC 338) TaxID=203275 RepID=G8ULR3_TANFA|nr:hypothetical protein BFO_2622 [Tannerella forsythia 92A2]